MKKIIIVIVLMSTFIGACKEEDFVLPKPENVVYNQSSNKIYNKENPSDQVTYLKQDGSINFIVEISQEADYDKKITLKKEKYLEQVVDKYNKYKHLKEYKILPQKNYDLVSSIIRKGTKSAEIQLDVKNYEELTQGNYILPVFLNVGLEDVMYLVFIQKDSKYVPLTKNNRKNMPSGAYSCPNRKEPMKMVAYVETNDYDIRNMGQFILKDSKKPVFDYVVLFAANMNFNSVTGKREVFFNDKLKPIIENPEIYIKPLHDRGIKVLIDVLPNHQGVGYANFQSYEEALSYAKDLKKITDKVGIDGWDIDEEYAEYYKQPGLPRKGVQSFLWYIRAMKEVMPDKLLTLYDYAHPLRNSSVDELGKHPSDYIDISWANYGEDHGSSAGLPEERYGRVSVEANRSMYASYVQRAAESNMENCNGLFMFFNINGKDIKNGKAATVLSEATRLFYGEECEFSGEYHVGPKG